MYGKKREKPLRVRVRQSPYARARIHSNVNEAVWSGREKLLTHSASHPLRITALGITIHPLCITSDENYSTGDHYSLSVCDKQKEHGDLYKVQTEDHFWRV